MNKKYVFYLSLNSKLIEHCKDLFTAIIMGLKLGFVAKGGMTNCISFEKS